MTAVHRLAAIGLFLGLAAPAAAHLMPAGRGTLNVVGDKAYIVASLPVAAFGQADTKDGVLTAAELEAGEGGLRAAVRKGLHVEVDGHAATFETILLNLPKGPDHAPDQGTELMVMIVAKLPGPPGSVVLRSSLWATDGDTLKIEATVTRGRRVTRRQVGELTPRASTYRFFASPKVVAPTEHRRGAQRHRH